MTSTLFFTLVERWQVSSCSSHIVWCLSSFYLLPKTKFKTSLYAAQFTELKDKDRLLYLSGSLRFLQNLDNLFCPPSRLSRLKRCVVLQYCVKPRQPFNRLLQHTRALPWKCNVCHFIYSAQTIRQHRMCWSIWCASLLKRWHFMLPPCFTSIGRCVVLGHRSVKRQKLLHESCISLDFVGHWKLLHSSFIMFLKILLFNCALHFTGNLHIRYISPISNLVEKPKAPINISLGQLKIYMNRIRFHYWSNFQVYCLGVNFLNPTMRKSNWLLDLMCNR